MKMARVLKICQVIALLHAADGFRTRPRSNSLKPAVKNTDADAPAMVVEEVVPVEEVEVVPVPVMEVVVVEHPHAMQVDGGQKESNGTPNKACAEELLKLKTDADRLQKAQECEKEHASVEAVVDALKKADLDTALRLTAETFEKCSGLEKACSEQFATDTVQKLRLSGMAVTEACSTAVQNSKADTSGVCMKNMTSTIVHALQVRDLKKALASAAHGLDSCMNVTHPCDFQFAPMVTMQIAEIAMQQAMQQEPPITEVLLSNLDRMQQMTLNVSQMTPCEKKLMNEADRVKKEIGGIMDDVKQREEKFEKHFEEMNRAQASRKKALRDAKVAQAKPIVVVQKKSHKRLSLLSVQDTLHLSFQRQRLAF